MLIKTLSHIWGKLNLPTLLFRVGLLTLIMSPGQASPADNTLSQAESVVSWAGIPPASQADSALPQAMSAVSQACPADNTLSQAESVVSQVGIPQAALVVRCSARLRASQVPPNNNPQAGNTSRADNTISQPDKMVSQVVSSQASASQEARSSPSPNRQNSSRVLPSWKNLTKSG